MISGDFGNISEESITKLQEDLREVERMLKALITSLENKPLNP